MTPFSERKLFEQITIVLGIVLGFVKCYINWKVNSRYHSVSDLLFNVLMVTVITSGILTALYLLIHHLERKWKTQISRRGDILPWKFRPTTDCGITLLPLFPMALLFGLVNFWPVISNTYMVITVVSLGFLFTSVAYLWKMCETFDNSLVSIFTVAAISSVKVSLVLWHLRLFGLLGSCLVAFGSQLVFLMTLHTLLSRCPRSFSIGEALLMAQGLVALLLAALVSRQDEDYQSCGSVEPCSLVDASTQLAFVLSLPMLLLLTLTLTVDAVRKPLLFYVMCGAMVVYLYLSWFQIVKEEPVMWLLRLAVGQSVTRRLLVGHWLLCSASCVLVVGWVNLGGTRINTTIRKVFHVAVILVFLPGLILDVDLLFLACSFALALFSAIECVRLLRMPPFGDTIHAVLKPFLDEKDSGCLILTHIYLLIGCSLSIFTFPTGYVHRGFHISLASGILSLGFGDTAASVGGVLFGKNQWPDSKKTWEGTVCAIAVQASASLLLYLLLSTAEGITAQIANSFYVLLATVLCCVLEGVTTQVDNLLLPTFMYMMLVAT